MRTIFFVDIAHVGMDEEGIITEFREAPESSTQPRVLAEHVQSNGTLVSTAFTPLCMRSEAGVPQCFETVVVRGHKSLVVRRYTDLHEALRGHDETVLSTA